MREGTARRSWLYVPGDRPERFAKAATSGVDVVICDLEDSVGPANKALARDAVVAWLRDHRAVVRVNGVDTPWHDDDVAAIANSPRLAGVVLPKSQEPDRSAKLVAGSGPIDLVPLVETAAGVANAAAIAADPQVSVLAFGSLDFALDLGIDDPDGEEQSALLYARSALVIASRVAGIAAPIDGVTVIAGRRRRDPRRHPPRPCPWLRRQAMHPPAAGARGERGVHTVARGNRPGPTGDRCGTRFPRVGGATRRPDDRQTAHRSGPSRACRRRGQPNSDEGRQIMTIELANSTDTSEARRTPSRGTRTVRPVR